MNYYYKSEFELIESFLDAAGDPVDITNIDIEIVYYTSGWERYTVSRIGGVPVNCVFSEAEPTKLTVVFQNHGLKEGALRREITLFVDNINFTSGKQKVALAPLTSINLVATSGEQGTAEATPVVVVSSSIFENIKYYYKTDFELIEQFFDSEGEAIDITNIDIQIIYLSQWGEYIVSKTSAGNNNCYLDELDSTKLHVVFQNHGLKEGVLRKEITLLIDNVNFASGKQKVMLNQESGVELVATGGDQGIGSGSNSIPVIVQSHTMPEKENIVDDDEVTGFDSEDNHKPIRYKKSKIKAFFKTFFDTVYAPANHNHQNVYEAANANIQRHIGNGDIHVTSDEKSNWNGRISYSVTRDIDGNIVTVTYANGRVVSITRVAGLITKYEDAVYEYVVNRTGVVFDGITVNIK
ncbi:MAG: hypothetical protein PHS04_04580 [Tissierellia bacterium]|nr:hypothetical protein [Tissierellia bacterium]